VSINVLMPMKKSVVFLCYLILLGCSSKKLDLTDLKLDEKPNVDLSGFTKDVREQKGRFELPTKDGVKLVDKGEKIVYYFFADNDNITFKKAKIASVLKTKVVTYNGLVSFVSVRAHNRDAPVLFQAMLKEYGTPDSISYDQRKFSRSEKGTLLVLKRIMPDLVKNVSDEFDYESTEYPQRIFWSKNRVLTVLTIDPVNLHLNMSINIITEKAYLDHIVEEYAKPLLKEYDVPFAPLFRKTVSD
jgi:hypothetical protein